MFDFKELLENLQIEQLDTLLFRGNSLPLPLPRVFGGQVLAQALNAAARTVDAERRCHSFHGYFLRPGNAERPIIYDVDPIRDGGSFTTRRVVAKQNGKAIFNCAASFQLVEEGLEHQLCKPEGIPEPETLETDEEWIKRQLEKNPEMPRPLILPLDAVDIRSVTARTPHEPEGQEPVQGYWLKFSELPEDHQHLHQTLLAYISDLALMGTALRPHGLGFGSNNLQGASLDHAMWFHSELNVDDWIYYHMDSPRSAHARGFNRGSFYNREGVLVASAAQEGLMRLR